MKAFRVIKGSHTERVLNSRKKVRLLGGGFGNGKTSTACMIALMVARDYPGCNILLARSTFPKLNSTLRKEFFKWCPRDWIKSFVKDDNECTLKNGSVINFRYLAQKGVSSEVSTSNVLSATYDLVIVDQVEDPELEYKDFLDVLGRLRGSADYIGSDPTMPKTGPRWFIMTTNPTRNWVYRKLVKPLKLFQSRGIVTEDLLIDNKTGECLIELIEASTYDNRDNLPEDFIETMESAYRGQMRDRFLLGKWAAYEGLIYSEFDADVHLVTPEQIKTYVQRLEDEAIVVRFIEAYDHGLAAPSCYMLALVDQLGNVIVVDGFYEKECPIDTAAQRIKSIRAKWGYHLQSADDIGPILADPAIFKRVSTDKRGVVGQTTAQMFADHQIEMTAANNNITDGIQRVQAFLVKQRVRRNPFTGEYGSPHLFINDTLTWFQDEISEYMWKKSSNDDDAQDVPTNKNDHAMDCVKYLLTKAPTPARIRLVKPAISPAVLRWNEQDLQSKQQRRGDRTVAVG
jgi:hypothetical protein